MPQAYNISDVMLSYSRRDKEFVQLLEQALHETGREIWVDWQDIAPTTDWWAEIQAGIEGAHTFVFIISPHSVRSEICRQEIEHAIKHNKRLVPVLREEINDPADKQRMHPSLNQHNWIYFRETDDFRESFQTLIAALETDLAHASLHTRLLVRAREWEERNRSASRLLRGDDLREAEEWLAQGLGKAPEPTALQADYIATSRKIANRNRQILTSAALIAMFLLGVLAVIAFGQSQRAGGLAVEAQANAQTAVANADLAQTEQANAENNLRTALAADDARATADAERELSDRARGTANAAAVLQQERAENSEATAFAEQTNAAGDQAAAATARIDADNMQSTADAAGIAATEASRLGGIAGTEAANLGVTANAAASEAARQATQAAAAVTQGAVAGTNAANASTQAAQQATQAAVIQQTAQAAGLTATADAIAAEAVRTEAAQLEERAQTLNLMNAAQELLTQDRALAMHLALLAVDRQGMAQPVDFSLESALNQVVYTVGQPSAILETTSNGFDQVTFNRRYDTVYAVSSFNAVYRWDLTSGQIQEILPTQLAQSNFLAVNSDESLLITGSPSRETIEIWDVEAGRMKHEIPTIGEYLTLSPDDQFLAAITSNGSFTVWDISGDEPKQFLVSDDLSMLAIAFSPDSQRIVSTDSAGRIFIWQLATRSLERVITYADASITSVVFSPDGRMLVTGADNGTIQLWNVDTGEPASARFQAHEKAITQVFFNQPSNRIVSFSKWDNEVRVWNNRGTALQSLEMPNTIFSTTNSIDMSADERWMIAGTTDGKMVLWDIDNGQETANLADHTASIRSLTFVPSENRLISGSDDGNVYLWNINRGRVITAIGNHNHPVRSVVVSPDGSKLLSSEVDPESPWSRLRLPHIWDINNGDLIRTFPIQGDIQDVHFSRDGTQIYIQADWNISTWETHTGQLLESSDGYLLSGIRTMATNPIREEIAFETIGYFTPGNIPVANLSIYDLHINEVHVNLQGNPLGTMNEISYSEDGRLVAAGGSQGIIWIWNANNGNLRRTLAGHTSEVTGLDFSPDRKRLVSASRDGTVRIWDVATGQVIGSPLRTNGGEVYDVAFSPDGKRIASAHEDGTIRIWANRSLPELIEFACENRYIRPLTQAEKAQYGITQDHRCAWQWGAPENVTLAQTTQLLSLPTALPTPTLAPTLTPSVTPMPEYTPAPQVVQLPLVAEMDDGAPGWFASGGWSLDERGRHGDAGLGWHVDSAISSTLDWNVLVDLTNSSSPQLSFRSRREGFGALPMVQVSTDGGMNWSLLETVLTSTEWTTVTRDLSEYTGRQIRLQFVWLPGSAPESWAVDSVRIEERQVVMLPTETSTPTTTPTPVPDIAATASPSPTETPLLPSVTPLPSFTPTATLVPRSLPLYATMDDGAPDWYTDGGWRLEEGARHDALGMGWRADSSELPLANLEWMQSIDLTFAQHPQLRLWSQMMSTQASAMLQITTDHGATWHFLSLIPNSVLWEEHIIDLSAYRGQIIRLRFTWLPPQPAPDQPLAYWMLDQVIVDEAPATLTPSATLIPTLTSTATETMTPTATNELSGSRPTLPPTETPTGENGEVEF